MSTKMKVNDAVSADFMKAMQDSLQRLEESGAVTLPPQVPMRSNLQLSIACVP